MTFFCCGCDLEDDYGTSVVTGEGSAEDPYTVTQIDPEFNRPVVRIGRATSQSIPNNTPTILSFSTEFFDSDSMWDIGAPTRFTIPYTGIYIMNVSFKWAQTTANRESGFILNGATELDLKSAQNSNVVAHPLNHTYMWYFTAGDYVEVIVFQNSGAPLNIVADATNPISAWMMYIGQKV